MKTRKLKTRLLAILLSFITSFTAIPIDIHATTISEAETIAVSDNTVDMEGETAEEVLPEPELESEPEAEMENDDIEVVGQDSFGNLLAEKIEEKTEECQKTEGYSIVSVEIEGKTATVEFNTLEDAIIIVGIYTEDKKTLVATGHKNVLAGENQAVLDIETDTMPEYFYVKAYLVNIETYGPLSQVYETPNYTKEMQDLFALTADQFDDSRVYNLDDDLTNNFGVFNEDVVVDKYESTEEQTVSNTDNVYVFENANDDVLALQPGDIYAWESENGLLIIKVDDIIIQDTTVTITAAETEMEEVFQHLKIDMQATVGDAVMDTSDIDEDLSYVGVVDDEEEEISPESGIEGEELQAETAISGELSKKQSFKYDFKENDYFEGSVNVKINPAIKYYLSFSLSYLEVQLKYEVKLAGEVKGERSVPFAKIGTPKFDFGDSLTLYAYAGIGLEFKTKMEVAVSFSGSIGFSASTDTGLSDISKNPKVKVELTGEASIYIGLLLDGEIKAFSSDTVNAKFEGRAGIEIKGSMVLLSTDQDKKTHNCIECIDGDVLLKLGLKVSASLTKRWKWSDSTDFSIKFLDWYYSFDNNKFGFGTCPNMSYHCTVAVKDEKGNFLDGVSIQFKQTDKVDYPSSYQTKKGEVSEYLKTDTYTVVASKEGYASAQKKLIVKDEPRSIQIALKKDDKRIVKFRHSMTEYAAIDGNDTLYYLNWGGLSSSSSISMKNVKDIQLGLSSTIVLKNDGSVWTWGGNEYGQIGNGMQSDESVKEPYHIFDDAKSICAGDDCFAVIKENGELWTWGNNWCGQIGQEIVYNSDTGENRWGKPACILQNVKKVFMDTDGDMGYQAAAITEDDELYIWGGENGASVKKVMQDVKDIAFGNGYILALKKDGTVWSWGNNEYGQLGLGTTTNQDTPQKVNLSNVSSIYTEPFADVSFAITDDGKLYVWGGYFSDSTWNEEEFRYDYNTQNAILTRGFSDCRKPCLVTTNVRKIAGYYGAMVVLKNDGTLWSWGYVYDYLSDLKKNQQNDQIYNSPELIKSGVKDITYADPDCCDIRFPSWSAVVEDGSRVYWGTNYTLDIDGYLTSDGTTNFQKITIDGIKNGNPIEAISSETNDAISVDLMSIISEDVTSGVESVANYEGLDTEQLYNFYVLKDYEGVEDIFDGENLLYLAQEKPDAEGKLSISYLPRSSYEGAQILLVGSEETNDYIKSEEGTEGEDQPTDPKEDIKPDKPADTTETQTPATDDTANSSKQKMCTVTYMNDTGLHAKALKVVEVPKGSTIASTGIEEPVAVKQGYTFKGWKHIGTKWDFNNDTVNWNITLVPIFEYIYLKGDTFDDGFYYYEITSVGKNPAVTVTGRCIDDYGDSVTYADEGYVNIPNDVTINGVTYKVTAIAKHAFLRQNDIERVKIGKNVTVIGKNAFYGCKKIEKLVIGANVTKIDSSAFSGCTSIKKVVIPSKVKTIGKAAFKGCKKISTLTLGKGVTNIGAMAFSGCTSLKKVTIPKGVKTIGTKAFYKCSKLKTVVVKANKLNTLGASSFKGIHKDASVKILKKYSSDMKSRCDSTTKVIGVNVF